MYSKSERPISKRVRAAIEYETTKRVTSQNNNSSIQENFCASRSSFERRHTSLGRLHVSLAVAYIGVWVYQCNKHEKQRCVSCELDRVVPENQSRKRRSVQIRDPIERKYVKQPLSWILTRFPSTIHFLIVVIFFPRSVLYVFVLLRFNVFFFRNRTRLSCRWDDTITLWRSHGQSYRIR